MSTVLTAATRAMTVEESDSESITSTQRNDQHQQSDSYDESDSRDDDDDEDEDDDDQTISSNSSNNQNDQNNQLLQHQQDNIDSEMRHGFGEAYSSEEYLQVSLSRVLLNSTPTLTTREKC
jgi:regulator-associated protein of mTOR